MALVCIVVPLCKWAAQALSCNISPERALPPPHSERPRLAAWQPESLRHESSRVQRGLQNRLEEDNH